MKKTKIISGVVALAALCGANAMAQISYQNGDLLAGFGNGASGATPDVVVDLGSIANFQSGGTQTFAGVSTALQSIFGSDLSGVHWSVFGINDTTRGAYDHSVIQTDPYTIWNTLARFNPGVQTAAPFVDGSSAQQQLAATDIGTIANLTSPSQAGPGQIVNLAPNIVSVKTSLGGYSSEMNSPYNGNLQGDWAYNIENIGAGVSDLYRSNPGNSFTQKGSYMGDFVLDSAGDLTFNPVPEPSTWTMLGAGLLTLLAVRRSRRNG